MSIFNMITARGYTHSMLLIELIGKSSQFSKSMQLILSMMQIYVSLIILEWSKIKLNNIQKKNRLRITIKSAPFAKRNFITKIT
jgi:hypothetical protein